MRELACNLRLVFRDVTTPQCKVNSEFHFCSQWRAKDWKFEMYRGAIADARQLQNNCLRIVDQTIPIHRDSISRSQIPQPSRVFGTRRNFGAADVFERI